MRVNTAILVGAARPGLALVASLPVERVQLRQSEISAGWLARAMEARTRPDVSLLILFPDGAAAAFVPPVAPKARTTRRQ